MATARLPEPAPPHLRPSRLSHLVIQSARFEEMVAWYKTVLGASPMFENDTVCLLTYDEEHHGVMIGRNPNATPRDPKAAGVDDYRSREAMDAWFATGAFDGDFVGVAFDPEEMARLHREDVPEDEILQERLYS